MRDEAQRLIDIFGGEVRHGETLADVAARVMTERSALRVAASVMVNAVDDLFCRADWREADRPRLYAIRNVLAALVRG